MPPNQDAPDLDGRLLLARKMRIANTVGFEPFTDANDCEAVIDWLQRQGYDVEIWWSGTAFTHRTNVYCRVRVKYRSDWSGDKIEGEAYDDWKFGVCTEALKVIRRPTETGESDG